MKLSTIAPKGVSRLWDAESRQYLTVVAYPDSTQTSYSFSGNLPIINPNIYIKEVIYSNPATIVLWSDNTKTVCKCNYPDVYSKETGLSICILKKIFGRNELRQLFNDWIPDQDSFTVQKITLRDIIKKNK